MALSALRDFLPTGSEVDQNVYRATFINPVAVEIPALSSSGRTLLIALIALLALWTISQKKLRARE